MATICPHCGAKFGEFLGKYDSEDESFEIAKQPEQKIPGSCTICAHCAGIGVFLDDGVPLAPTTLDKIEAGGVLAYIQAKLQRSLQDRN